MWKKSSDELKSFLKQSLLEYHLDRVEILYDTMLEIQGWAVDQRGETEITALNQERKFFCLQDKQRAEAGCGGALQP